MSQINPFVHAVFQGIQAQRTASIAKERQLRRAQVTAKDVAAQEDRLEHQVESPEEEHSIQDESQQSNRRPKRQPPTPGKKGSDTDDEKPHIDLTA